MINSNNNLPNNVEKMTPKEIVRRNYDKIYWKNGAESLKLLEIQKIIEIVPEMFEWLQDLNWPGTKEIMDILVSLPRQILMSNLERAIKVAINQDDHEWLFHIVMFLKIKKIIVTKNDFKDEETYKSITLIKNNG